MKTVRAFGYGSQIAVASNMSFVEVWNAATSGKTVKVTRIEINSKDTAVSLWNHTAQQGAAGTAGVKQNKLLGGVAPSVAIYGEDILTTVLGTKMYTVTTVADTVKVIDCEDSPIMINPGMALIVANDTVNLAMTRVSVTFHEIELLRRRVRHG